MMVQVVVLSSDNTLALSALSKGRNASKVNLLVGSPDIISALIHATGPGIGITSILLSIACLTSSSPGSDIPLLQENQDH